MKKSNLALIGSIAVLLTLVLTTFVTTKRSSTGSPASSSASSQKDSSSQPQPALPQESRPNLDSATSTKSPLSRLANTQTSKAISPPQHPAEQSIRKLLARSEALLTREVLPDGTELIHLNGSQGHLSAASISPDGTINTQCHSSPEALFSQTSRTHLTPAAKSGPALLTR